MRRLYFMFVVILTSQAVMAAGIPMVGLDEQGYPLQTVVPKELYERNLTEALTSVHQSTLPILQRQAKGGKWTLNALSLGIGLNVEAGITPLFKMSAAPRFRLLFANSLDPAVP